MQVFPVKSRGGTMPDKSPPCAVRFDMIEAFERRP